MAKKKYYQDKKDRMDESRGMKKGKSGFDFGNDESAPYNMPTRSVMRDYPVCGYSLDGSYPDSLAGVDDQIDSDARVVVRNASRGGDKY